jgi:uncharacterized membrane-anchored protein YitT (DUF2179 family)
MAGFWCLLYMKETSGGLTDSEKKSLYIPTDLIEYTKIKQEEMARNTMISLVGSQDRNEFDRDSSILSELTREMMCSE